MKKTTKLLVGIISGIVAMLVGVKVASNIQKKQNKEDTKNPFEGKKVVFIEDASKPENADGMRGYLQAVEETQYEPTFYDKYIKRGIDIILAFDEAGSMISICDETLTIPHPYFWDRTFVLEPLHELLPTFTYKGMTIGERLTQLSLS